MNYFWVFMVSAFSICLPLTVYLARINRFGKRYHPLLFLLLTGMLNEITSYLMIRQYRNNLVNSNTYTLVEYLLVSWLFFNISQQKVSRVQLAVFVATMVWIADNFWWHGLQQNNIIFRIFSSIMFISLSMDKINQLVIGGLQDPYKNTDLLLCFSFLVYHAYRVLIHIFNLFVKNTEAVFFARLWLILCCLNLLANITYTIAILCIPKQKSYTRY